MSFKDSGVKWIGKIPSHWGISKIKYQTEINKHTLNDQTSDDYIIQYIDIGNVNSEGQIQELQEYKFSDAPSRARRIVKKNDLLISTVRTYLKAITSILDDVEDNTICSTGFAVLTPKETMDPLYLHYLSRSEMYIDEIVSRSTGVSYPAINASDIAALECILPPLDEQQMIGKFLYKKSSEVESIIQSKLKYMELLEQQRQSIITEAVTKGLNPNVKMKDSGVEWIGEIPEHWRLVQLTHVSKITRLAGYEYTEYWEPNEDGEIVALRGQNIGVNEVNILGNEERITEALSQRLGRSRLYSGDVVFPCVGSIGKAACIYEDDKFHINQNIAKLTPSDNLDSEYLTYYLNSELTKYQIRWYNTSEMQPSVLVGNLRKFKITLPPIDEQKKVIDSLKTCLDEMNDLIGNVQKQINSLKEYRQALIYEAVTGKIDVRELELD